MTDDDLDRFIAAQDIRPKEITFRLQSMEDGHIESSLEASNERTPRSSAILRAAQLRRWSSASSLTERDMHDIAGLVLQDPLQRATFSEIFLNAARTGREIRLVITPISNDLGPNLDAIPWEASLYFLLGHLDRFADQVSLVRRDSGPARPGGSTLFPRVPLRFVATAAHSVKGHQSITGMHPLDDYTIEDLGHEVAAVISDTPPAQRLFDDLSSFDVFHFSGHGTEDGLVGATGPLPGAELGWRLSNHETRLAVLVACNSASDGKARRGHVGVAWHVRADVPAVVGMQREILSSDADMFVSRFYAGMRIGGSLDRAFAAARERLFRDGKPFWIPILYLAPGIEDTSIVQKAKPRRIAPRALPSLSEAMHAVDTREQVLLLEFSSSDGIRRLPAANHSAKRDPHGRVALSSDGRVAASFNSSGMRVHWVGEKSPPRDPVLPDGVDAHGRLLAIRSVHSTMVQALVATEREVLAIVRLADERWSSPRVILARPGIVAATWVDGEVVYVDEDGSVECLHSDPLNFGLRVAGVDSVTVPDGTLLVGWGTGASRQRAFTLLGRAAGQTRWESLLDREENVLAVGIVRPPRVLPRPGEITIAIRTESETRLETIGMQWTARI